MLNISKTMTATPIDNRNFLSPTGFIFKVDKIPKTSYFCNQASIPSLDLGVATQPTYLKDIDIPGDKIEFGDLNIRFLIDEDFGNYMEIQNWIRGLGYPEYVSQFEELQTGKVLPTRFKRKENTIYSDAVLQILGSTMAPKFQVNFKDIFPVSLSTLTFDSTDTDIEYFTAEVSFKYTIYNITNLRGQDL